MSALEVDSNNPRLSPRKRNKSPTMRNKSPTTLIGNVSKMEALPQNSHTQLDKELVNLLQEVPSKHKIPNLWMKTFHLYPIALEVCQVVSSGQQPPRTGFSFPKKSSKRAVYQLVFDTLYHHEVLEELLIESSFYAKYFDLHADKMLLHIMLFDFQNHKFSLRFPRNTSDNIPGPVSRISQALWHHRVKLNATLARMRVKSNSSVISQLIPDKASREIYEANKSCPCFTRINSIKIHNVQTEMLNQLCSEGFSLLDPKDEHNISKCKKSVCLARRDFLLFSPDCRAILDIHPLVENGSLILQDYSSYMFVDEIQGLIEQCGGDVIVTELNSGIELSHIATILGHKGTVFVFNMQPREIQPIKAKISFLGLTNIKFMEIPFEYVSDDDDDDALSNVKVIVCLPLTTASTTGHCVDFILREGDNMLPAMLQPSKGCITSQSPDINSLSSALTFTQVGSIVYKSWSNQNAQDEISVKEILDEHNSKNDCKKIKCDISHGSHNIDPLGKRDYITAVIEQESEKPPPPPRDVIERAIAKGIITGEGISGYVSTTKLSRNRRGKGSIKSNSSCNSSTIGMTIAAQQKVVQKKEATTQKIFRP